MSPSQPSTSRPSTSQPSASHRLQTTGASRAAILDALRRADGPLTVQELADSLSLHGNTVRFHLARLAKDGRVREERVGPSGPGRPKLAYTAVEEQAEALSKQLDDESADASAVATAAHLERKLTGLRRALDALAPGTGTSAALPSQN